MFDYLYMVINSYLLQTVLNVLLLILQMWNYLAGERLSLFYFFCNIALHCSLYVALWLCSFGRQCKLCLACYCMLFSELYLSIHVFTLLYHASMLRRTCDQYTVV